MMSMREKPLSERFRMRGTMSYKVGDRIPLRDRNCYGVVTKITEDFEITAGENAGQKVTKIDYDVYQTTVVCVGEGTTFERPDLMECECAPGCTKKVSGESWRRLHDYRRNTETPELHLFIIDSGCLPKNGIIWASFEGAICYQPRENDGSKYLSEYEKSEKL